MDEISGNGADSVSLVSKWEDAYAVQMHDATVGRLFRGIIHNLNGAVQAFSMQSELFALMFQQVEQSFDRIFNGTETEKNDALEKLFALLKKRAVLAEQMNDKVGVCQQIVQRTLSLSKRASTHDPDHYLLADLVKEEMDFLCADSFFKHKVCKEAVLDKNIALPRDHFSCLRFALQAVLLNALESMKEGTMEARIRVAAKRFEKSIELEVTDNGPGFSEEIRQQMFLPFFSTRENHAGLGLYLARKSLEQLGGAITASCDKGSTTFLLQFCPSVGSMRQEGR